MPGCQLGRPHFPDGLPPVTEHPGPSNLGTDWPTPNAKLNEEPIGRGLGRGYSQGVLAGEIDRVRRSAKRSRS